MKAACIPMVAACVFAAVCRADVPSPGHAGKLPAASRQSLLDKEARPFVFADPDWFQWGGSCILGEDGKYHLFYARWPRDNPRGMFGWLYVSEIARAVADKPEGPYVHQETVLKGFGEPQQERWDAHNAHNPCITRMKDPDTGKLRYYLYFIANRDDDETASDWLDRVVTQRVGVASADSPAGPWKRHDKPVIAPPAGPLRRYVTNPGVCQLPDGRYLMVLKGRANEGSGEAARRGNFGPMLHGWALADRPEGPFVAQDSLLFPASVPAEDPCVWVQGGWIFCAVKDWHGKLGGQTGISYVRGKLDADGKIDWQVPENASITPREIRWDDGIVTKLDATERPFVLRDASGKPSHLFMAASELNPFANGNQKPRADGKVVPLRNLPFNLCLPLVPTPGG